MKAVCRGVKRPSLQSNAPVTGSWVAHALAEGPREMQLIFPSLIYNICKRGMIIFKFLIFL